MLNAPFVLPSSSEEWRLDVQGNYQKELESRGVLDPKALPNYAYRDDGGEVYRAIDTYVKKLLRHYYGNCDEILIIERNKMQ